MVSINSLIRSHTTIETPIAFNAKSGPNIARLTNLEHSKPWKIVYQCKAIVIRCFIKIHFWGVDLHIREIMAIKKCMLPSKVSVLGVLQKSAQEEKSTNNGVTFLKIIFI